MACGGSVRVAVLLYCPEACRTNIAWLDIPLYRVRSASYSARPIVIMHALFGVRVRCSSYATSAEKLIYRWSQVAACLEKCHGKNGNPRVPSAGKDRKGDRFVSATLLFSQCRFQSHEKAAPERKKIKKRFIQNVSCSFIFLLSCLHTYSTLQC